MAGIEGGVGNTEQDKNTDGEDDKELAEFLAELWKVFGSEAFLVGAAAEKCVNPSGGFSDLGYALPTKLHDRLAELQFQHRTFTKTLGIFFRDSEGHWTASGYVLRARPRKGDSSKTEWVMNHRTPSDQGVPTSQLIQPVSAATVTHTRKKENTSSKSNSAFACGGNKLDMLGRGGVSHCLTPPVGTPLSFDFETCSVERLWSAPWPGFCRLLAVSDGEQVWCTADHDEMRSWLLSAGLLVGHNTLGYDVFAAAWHLGMDFEELVEKTVDTRVLARLVEPPAAMTDENGKPNAGRLSYHLDDVAQRMCGVGKSADIRKLAAKHNRKAKLADKFESIPVDDPEYIEYVCQDARISWAVYQEQMKRLTDEGYAWREMRLARLAARITWVGFGVDLDVLQQRVEDDAGRAQYLIGRLGDVLGVKIGKRLGDVAKIALGEFLDDYGVKVKTTDSDRVATDRETMTQLAKQGGPVGEIAEAIMALNGDRGMPAQIQDCLGADGRVHPFIDMNSQASGRWSVTRPGLTTFGKRSESLLRDRDLFRARPGHVLLSCDLANIDVRGMAALSQDPAMIARLQPGLPLDWHEQVAEVVFGDPGRRKDAKALAHAINYNAGPGTVSASAGVSYAKAQEIIATLNKSFPDLAAFKKRIVAAAEQGDPVTNGWGRVLTVSVGRSFTQAPGLSGQSWARDAVMECLLRMQDAGVSMYVVAHIHDEFVLEIPLDQFDEIAALVGKAMTFERDGVPVLSEASTPQEVWGQCYRPEQ